LFEVHYDEHVSQTVAEEKEEEEEETVESKKLDALVGKLLHRIDSGVRVCACV
jgi:hypothetical protein